MQPEVLSSPFLLKVCRMQMLHLKAITLANAYAAFSFSGAKKTIRMHGRLVVSVHTSSPPICSYCMVLSQIIRSRTQALTLDPKTARANRCRERRKDTHGSIEQVAGVQEGMISTCDNLVTQTGWSTESTLLPSCMLAQLQTCRTECAPGRKTNVLRVFYCEPARLLYQKQLTNTHPYHLRMQCNKRQAAPTSPNARLLATRSWLMAVFTAAENLPATLRLPDVDLDIFEYALSMSIHPVVNKIVSQL